MKKQRLGVAVAALLVAGTAVAESPWHVRMRAVDIRPDLSTNNALSALDVSNELVPELDISYFFTPHLAAELILGTARHDLTLGGADIGELSHLPPTVTIQYHFMPSGVVRPYAGVGVNYTRFYNQDLAPGLSVSKNSVGPALQLGLDVPVGKTGYVNLDAKKIYISTDVTAAGTKLGTVDLDPWVIGVGYGFRF